MHPCCVVEAFDVGKHAAPGFLPRLKAAPVRLLDLQAVPEALHRRAIFAVTRATHRLPVAHLLQMIARLMCRVLAALV